MSGWLPALDRKLLRELWGMKGQLFTIALVLGSGMASFIMLRGVYDCLEASRDAYYDRTRFAHVFATVESAPNALVERIEKLDAYYRSGRPDPDVPVAPVKIDRQMTFDRLTNVHYSGTRHAEDQPAHLIVHDTDICRTRCRVEFGNPCTRFCPANVYEMVDAGDGTKRLQINASNCVHCKTCDIMDPYQIVDWVPPEGGGGPGYEGM